MPNLKLMKSISPVLSNLCAPRKYSKVQILSPRDSAEYIVERAKHVKVCCRGIEALTRQILDRVKSNEISVKNFSQHNFHPKPTDPSAIDWIFLVDTLNFCFWKTSSKKYTVEGHSGYFALCAAINRALKEGIPITDPNFYFDLNIDDLEHILRSDDGTVINLLPERLNCLHEVGSRLIAKWDSKFANVVAAADKSAQQLLLLIVNEFPCFRDEANFEGARVSLYKRAQILIGDLWSCFEGAGPGTFNDLDSITMFADYRVPQVLVHFGCLQYSDELMEKLNKDEILKIGDPMEVEIRGASIYVVEKIKDASKVNSVLIDQYLWDYRRSHAASLEHIPFHKTRSIFY